MGLFERYLSLWVAMAILAGVLPGQFVPVVPETLSRFELAQVSIPVTLLICWAMIFPMMAQIDFSAVLGVRRQPRGLVITTTVNWLIKPFTMFASALSIGVTPNVSEWPPSRTAVARHLFQYCMK
ncbi:ACR3 family arsenite efflux pump ArsB [Halomonas stenophila]|uniref:ACR3 family arsenite efflux pump ArsB n=1 Tax=Halomonas stenophila TaxID=795312 RepID=A0A7W5ERS4_9GAMM|nr:ACR3 family arsenite efflux pump ArsB [Halomonas stenophila]